MGYGYREIKGWKIHQDVERLSSLPLTYTPEYTTQSVMGVCVAG